MGATPSHAARSHSTRRPECHSWLIPGRHRWVLFGTERIRESRIASHLRLFRFARTVRTISFWRAAVAVDRGGSTEPDYAGIVRMDRRLSLSIDLVRGMRAMRRQGQDARECAGADGDHQEQTDAEAASSRG
jgi:hypothetical protein